MIATGTSQIALRRDRAVCDQGGIAGHSVLLPGHLAGQQVLGPAFRRTTRPWLVRSAGGATSPSQTADNRAVLSNVAMAAVKERALISLQWFQMRRTRVRKAPCGAASAGQTTKSRGAMIKGGQESIPAPASDAMES